MNFKLLLFHVLGKPIKMLMTLGSYLPQTLLCIRIYLHGLERGEELRDTWGALFLDPTAGRQAGKQGGAIKSE